MKREKSKIKRTIAFCMAFLLAVSMITPWSGAQPVEAASKKTGKTSKINKVSDVFSVKRVPEDMANLPDSAYDNAGSTPFLLVEQNELYFLNTRSNGSTVADIFDTSRLSEYTTDLKKSTGAVLDTSINKANAGKYSQLSSDGDFGNLDYAHGVAFDPTGSGRKDHVAVVGVQNTAKDRFRGVLVIQNTKNGKTWTKDLDNCNWMKNLAYWQAANYLSITAGDYDHNGKDSVVVYCGGDDVFNVYEFEFDGNELKKPDVAVDIKANLLSRRAGFSATGDTALNLQPNVKPVVSLTTGDFDADGIDELAYMCGFMKFSGPDGVNKKNYQNLTSNYGLEPYSAHVNVLEYNNDRWTSGTAMYLYTRGDKCTSKDDPKNAYQFTIMHAGSIAAGDLDGDGTDELIAVGYTSDDARAVVDGSKITQTKGVEYFDPDDYAYSVIRYIGKGEYRADSVNKIAASPFAKAHFTNSDTAFQQIAVACGKVNGAKKPEAVFIGGVIYSFESNSPQKLFEGDMSRALDKMLGINKNSKDTAVPGNSSVNFVQNVTAGNFDGNDAGREQFVFVALEKRSGKKWYSANLGVIAGIEYNDTVENGQVTVYGSTTTYASSFYIEDVYYNRRYFYEGDKNATQVWKEMNHNFNSTSNQLNCLPIAIDNDNDGLLVRQPASVGTDKKSNKAFVYTDPEVIAVLQAAPYFQELDDMGMYPDTGTTSYSIETSYSYSTSTGHNVSFGVGFAGESTLGPLKVAVEAGYSLDWSNTFEDAIDTSHNTDFTIGKEDAVVISRTPEAIYCYDVYKDGKWIENGYTMRVPLTPEFFLLTVDDYNEFVQRYNKLVNTTALKPVDSTVIPDDHYGNPYAYYHSWKTPRGGVNLSSSSYSSSAGTGAITSSYSKSESKTKAQEMSHGFNYSCTVQGGYELDGVGGAWAGGYVNLDYSNSTGSSTTNTKGTSASGTVFNPSSSMMAAADIEDDYSFNWTFGMWKAALQPGRSDVLVYGYVTSNIAAPPIPVNDLKGQFTTNDEGKMAILLEWSPIVDAYRPASGYVITLYEQKDGSKKKDATEVATLKADASEFLFDGVDGRDEYSFTIKSYQILPNEGDEILYSVESDPVVLDLENKSIYDISLTEESEEADVYTISYTDGTVTEFTVKHGKNGKDGKDGVNGRDGSNGTNGLSAYEIAKKNGFTGTETEWLASLKGEKGDPGTSGTGTGTGLSNDEIGFRVSDYRSNANSPQQGRPAMIMNVGGTSLIMYVTVEGIFFVYEGEPVNVLPADAAQLVLNKFTGRDGTTIEYDPQYSSGENQ